VAKCAEQNARGTIDAGSILPATDNLHLYSLACWSFMETIIIFDLEVPTGSARTLSVTCAPEADISYTVDHTDCLAGRACIYSHIRAFKGSPDHLTVPRNHSFLL